MKRLSPVADTHPISRDQRWQDWHARLPAPHKAFVARCLAAGLLGPPEKFEALLAYLPIGPGGSA